MNVFKKTVIIPPCILSILILTSCAPKNEPAVDEFKEFVVQVEHSIKDQEVKDWNEFEQEYHQRMDQLDDKTDKLSEEASEEVDSLKMRYEKLKSEWEQSSTQAKQDLSDAMNDLTNFVNDAEENMSDQTEEAMQTMSEEFQTRKQKVMDAAKAAGQDVDSMVQELNDRFTAAQKAWKDEAGS